MHCTMLMQPVPASLLALTKRQKITRGIIAGHFLRYSLVEFVAVPLILTLFEKFHIQNLGWPEDGS